MAARAGQGGTSHTCAYVCTCAASAVAGLRVYAEGVLAAGHTCANVCSCGPATTRHWRRRGAGHTCAYVCACAKNFLRGYSEGVLDAAHTCDYVCACAKHFPRDYRHRWTRALQAPTTAHQSTLQGWPKAQPGPHRYPKRGFCLQHRKADR